MAELVIDKEFSKFLPALMSDEFAGLSELIKRDGCLHPLTVWRCDGQLLLVDGFNRYKICQKHEIKYEIVEKSFESREQVFQWMYENQDARRNWIPAVRIETALKLKPILAAEAAARKQAALAKNIENPAEIPSGQYLPDESQETRDAVAEMADVSHTQVDKMEDVLESGTKKLKQAVRDGKLTISAAAQVAKRACSEVQDAVADGDIPMGLAKKLGTFEKDVQVVRLGRILAIRKKSGDTASALAVAEALEPEEDDGKEEDETVEGVMRAKNKEIESFCRKLMKLVDEELPEDKWLNDMNRRNGAIQKFKDGCSTLRTCKCQALCPMCKGDGCARCHKTGRVPKYTYDQLVG